MSKIKIQPGLHDFATSVSKRIITIQQGMTVFLAFHATIARLIYFEKAVKIVFRRKFLKTNTFWPQPVDGVKIPYTLTG